MSDTPKKLIVTIGGAEEYVDYTPEEIAQREADAAAFEAERVARQEAEDAKATARAAALSKLAALGLTEEEVAAL